MRLLHFFILFLSLSIAVEAAQEILLYASFDGTTMAAGPFYVQPNVYARPFPRPNVTFDKGIRGQAAKLGAGPHGGRQVVYPVIPNLDRNRGTLLVWFRVDSNKYRVAIKTRGPENIKSVIDFRASNWLSAKSVLIRPKIKTNRTQRISLGTFFVLNQLGP